MGAVGDDHLGLLPLHVGVAPLLVSGGAVDGDAARRRGGIYGEALADGREVLGAHAAGLEDLLDRGVAAESLAVLDDHLGGESADAAEGLKLLSGWRC